MPRFSGTPVGEEKKPRFGGTRVEEKPEREEEAWYQDLAEGVGLSGLETYYGAKDLFTDLSDEEKARLEDWREDAGQSGWGTAGRVVGELGQLALPGAGVLKAAKAAQAAGKIGKTAGILSALGGEVGLAAGHGGLKAPKEGTTRGQEAFQSGLGALAGAGAGKLLKTAAKGIAKTKAAQELLDEGVYLTPGQAADSMSVQMLENAAEVTPFLARGTKKAKQAAKESWNESVLKKALPANAADSVDEIGQAGARQLEDAINTGYEKAWSNVDIPPSTMKKVYQGALSSLENVSKKEATALKRVLNELEGGADVKILDDVLRKEIATAKNKYFLKESLQGLRSTLREGLPEANLKQLQIMDAAYPKYLAAMKSVSRAAEDGGVFTPKQLVQSARQVGGTTKTATGRAPLQEVATQGMETVGQEVGGAPLDFFRRLAGAVPSPPGMRATGRAFLGETAPQKAFARKVYDPTADILRDYISGARVGAAYEE